MKTWFASNWLKLLALVMVLSAIYPIGYYVYYQFMGWVVVGAVVIAALQAHQMNRSLLMWVLILVGVVFNPIAPFYLGATVWQALDMVAAFIFLVSIVTLRSK